MFDFRGRSAIVTGAGSEHGIGREAALMLAEAGADVMVADLNYEGALKNAEEFRKLNVRAEAARLDATDPESVQAMVDAAVQAFGKVDILVNSAGMTQPIRTLDMTLTQFDRVMRVNLSSVFLCCRAVLPVMIANRYGRIVSVSSVSAKRGGGVFGGAHYSASKAGILGFSKNLAREVVAEGITVNSVCPGLIATDFRRSATGLCDEAERALWEDIPLKRPGTPREVAAAIVFLASTEAAFITGEEIDINGGAHID